MKTCCFDRHVNIYNQDNVIEKINNVLRFKIYIKINDI